MDLYINAFLALFAVMNPVGSLPVFSDLTAAMDQHTRRRVFNVATLTGLVTLMILTFAGQWIMQSVFLIEMAEFKIAGGIMLVVIAVRNIVFPGEDSKAKAANAVEIGAVPIAVPILVGPGAVITGILILNRDGWNVACASIAAVFVATWLVMQGGHILSRLLGRIGSLALSRILQVFICAIGAHFLTSGIKEIFHLK
jgi:multiple antibiotic resistance protein